MQIRKAMILAAGYGKRMLPLTETVPKPLIKIGPKNLLERSVELLIKIGVNEIVINIYHLSNEIEKFICRFDNQSKFQNDLDNGIKLIQIIGNQFCNQSYDPLIDQNTGFNLSILKSKNGQIKNLIFTKPTIIFSQKGLWKIKIENDIFEINSKHKLLKKLKDLKGKQFNSFVDFLYDYAVIAEGGSPQDPSKYLRQLDKYLS